MIFAYLPWNETVEDETGKQQWPVVSCQQKQNPALAKRRLDRGTHCLNRLRQQGFSPGHRRQTCELLGLFRGRADRFKLNADVHTIDWT
jgi:hypothetical protein